MGELFEFPASELTSGGNQTAAVILMGGGSLSDPGQIGFDSKGNLWVTSYSDDTVVMFSKSQLSASNDDAPAVTISSSSLVGPWGVAFHSGDLWVLDYGDGNAQKFLKGQLKSSGAPAPKVLLTGAAIDNNWEITFGPKFGKQPLGFWSECGPETETLSRAFCVDGVVPRKDAQGIRERGRSSAYEGCVRSISFEAQAS